MSGNRHHILTFVSTAVYNERVDDDDDEDEQDAEEEEDEEEEEGAPALSFVVACLIGSITECTCKCKALANDLAKRE